MLRIDHRQHGPLFLGGRRLEPQPPFVPRCQFVERGDETSGVVGLDVGDSQVLGDQAPAGPCDRSTERVVRLTIIGHTTDRVREHYSTVGADEARGIGERIISLVPAVHRTRGG